MRTTGASPEQIEAAVFMVARRNYLSDEATFRAIHQSKTHGPDNDLVTINQAATALCNTDHRIVRVDDLRALAHVLELFAPEYTTNEQAAIDRIQALIGEAE